MELAARLVLTLPSMIGRFPFIYCYSDWSVRGPFVSFVFVFDKLFLRHLYLLISVKRLCCRLVYQLSRVSC